MVKDGKGKWDRRGMAVATNGQHEESVVMKMLLGEKTHKGMHFNWGSRFIFVIVILGTACDCSHCFCIHVHWYLETESVV